MDKQRWSSKNRSAPPRSAPDQPAPWRSAPCLAASAQPAPRCSAPPRSGSARPAQRLVKLKEPLRPAPLRLSPRRSAPVRSGSARPTALRSATLQLRKMGFVVLVVPSRGHCLSTQTCFPTTAASAQFRLLCCQPEPTSELLKLPGSPQPTLGGPCRLAAW